MDSETLLDDVGLAKKLLENASRQEGRLNGADIVFGLRNLLRMKYYPVAVKFFFRQDELEAFTATRTYKTALRPYTFCHYVAASRQRGDVLLGTREKLGCSNARYVLGWKELDETEIRSHLKYARSPEQAEKFVRSKERLAPRLLAFATAPLHKAPFGPDVILGVCDPLQSYHLAVDWCAAFDEHPFTMTLSVNSSVCLGCVRCHVTGRPNVIPMCSGSKTAGKTEQGEVNWIWPGGQLEATFRWTLERTIRDGGVSFPRTGETYPGLDLCKLCGFVSFVEPESVGSPADP